MNNDTTKIPGYRLSRILTPEQVQGVRERWQWISDTLSPTLEVLTAEERKSKMRISAKLEIFSDESLQFAKERPDVGPACLVVDDFQADGESADMLASFFRPMFELGQQLQDNFLIARDNYCSTARAYYASAKENAKRKRPGAQQIVDRLAKAFEGQGAKGTNEPVPAPNPAPAPTNSEQ